MAPTCSNLPVPMSLVVSFHIDSGLKPMDGNKCDGNNLEKHLHIGTCPPSAYRIPSSHVEKLDWAAGEENTWNRIDGPSQELCCTSSPAESPDKTGQEGSQPAELPSESQYPGLIHRTGS